jgi:hypothetical protein
LREALSLFYHAYLDGLFYAIMTSKPFPELRKLITTQHTEHDPLSPYIIEDLHGGVNILTTDHGIVTEKQFVSNYQMLQWSAAIAPETPTCEPSFCLMFESWPKA